MADAHQYFVPKWRRITRGINQIHVPDKRDIIFGNLMHVAATLSVHLPARRESLSKRTCIKQITA